MKTMKKLVAALLVMTMVLALAGTAMASCNFDVHDFVQFKRNSVAYSQPRSSKDTSTIVSKTSIGCVEEVIGNWVLVRLTPYGTDGNYTCPAFGTCWAFWFKAGDLRISGPAAANNDVLVRFSNGGVGLSDPGIVAPGGAYVYFKDEGATRISDDCFKKVKATAKVWLHWTPSLSNSYGKALHKDQKVTYRRVYSTDDRGVPFYGVWKSGKCLWVSSLYTVLVKR